MKFLLVWCGLSIVIAVALGSLNWSNYRRIAVNGVATKGVVEKVPSEEHNSVRYAYQIGDRTFHGKSSPETPNPTSSRLIVGQSLVIYYDPEHPEKSVAGDPKPIFRNETVSVLSASILVSGFIVVVLKRRISGK